MAEGKKVVLARHLWPCFSLRAAAARCVRRAALYSSVKYATVRQIWTSVPYGYGFYTVAGTRSFALLRVLTYLPTRITWADVPHQTLHVHTHCAVCVPCG